ncbi:MAG: riboflavin synthase [Desulfuromonadia bacterium]
MFTGLIEAVGRVTSLARSGPGGVISIRSPLLRDVAIGDSVAVDGVCLTLTSLRNDEGGFDISAETLSRSTLGERRQGDRVNLERALRLGDRLGGHLVSGHVDSVGRVSGRREEGGNIRLTIDLPPGMGRYLVEKGSVAVDGISLTVNGVTADRFSLNVIPHTGRETTIASRTVGDRVNIELDIIGKYVEKLLSHRSVPREGLASLLQRHGFI